MSCALIRFGVEAKTNRLIWLAAPWITAIFSPLSFKSSRFGALPRKARSSSSSWRMACENQSAASRSQAPPGAKPQPQSAAPAAICSSQFP